MGADEAELGNMEMMLEDDADVAVPYGDKYEEVGKVKAKSSDPKESAEEILRTPVGKNVMVFTGAFYHNGQLIGENHEWLVLEKGSVQVYETGEVESMYKTGKCPLCESFPTRIWIRKAPVTVLSEWPHKGLVTRDESRR